MLEVWDVTLDRLKPAHLVAGKVLLSAHVPLGGRPAYKAPTVSSRVVRPDSHSFGSPVCHPPAVLDEGGRSPHGWLINTPVRD